MPDDSLPWGQSIVANIASGSSPPPDSGIEFGKPSVYNPTEVPSFSPEGLAEVPTAIGHGLAYGVGDVAALPATLKQLVGAGSEYGQMLYGYGRELLGYDPSGTTEAGTAARAKAAQAAMTPSEAAGKTTNVFGYQYPTSAGMEDIIQKTLNLTQGPAKSTLGRYTESAARAIPSMIVGGPEGLGAKVLTGAGMGLASQAGEETSEALGLPAPLLTLPMAIAGGKVGTKLAESVQGVMRPELQAQKQLAEATARDVASRKGAFRGVYDEQGNLITPGASIAEAASGPAASKLIGKAGGITPQTTAELSQINSNLASRASNIKPKLGDFIRSVTGVTEDAPTLESAVDKLNRQNIDSLYDLARNNPAAADIRSPGVFNAMQGNAMGSAAQKAASFATNPGSGIIAPQIDRATNTIAHGGNLAFYDQVSRNLADEIESLQRAGKNNEARVLIGLRKNLLSELDNVVPDFGRARGAAFDNFGQQDAIRAGFGSISERNPFSLRDIFDAYQQSTPEQQNLFQQGLGFAMENIARNRGPSGVINTLRNPETNKFLQAVLPADTFSAINGRSIADSMLEGIAPFNPWQPNPKLINSIVRGGLSTDAIKKLFSGDVWGAAASTAGIAGTEALNWLTHFQDNRKAMALLNYIQSTDPKDMAKFYGMVKRDPALKSAYGKILDVARKNSALSTVIEPHLEQGAPHYETVPAHPAPDGSGAWTNLKDEDYRAFRGSQHATGGRIERASGGRAGLDHKSAAEALMRAAEQAKKAENETTEPLLNLPDEAITKALSAANEAI